MKVVIPRLFFLFFSFIFLSESHATHIMGFDLSYECVSPCSYRLKHVMYFDCCGSFMQRYIPLAGPTVNNPNFTITQGSINFTGEPAGCDSRFVASTWKISQINDVTPVCGNSVSTCLANPTTPQICGVMEVNYESVVNTCAGTGATKPCDSLRITHSSSARNSIITSGAANAGLFTNSTVIDLKISPCNNSPAFLEPPVSFICLSANTPQTYNQAAFDPDGDLLVYRLIPCQRGLNQSVGYNTGFSHLNPLGPNWQVTLDPVTGDITFTPTPGSVEIGVICFEVLEYRNGVLIGSVMRDMQVQVLSLNCGQAPQIGAQNHSLGNVALAPASPTVVDACVGAEVCLDIPVVNPGGSLNYTISWKNNGLSGATFVDAANGAAAPFTKAGNLNPAGRFCWTPAMRGQYSFTVRVKDDQCPLSGIQDQTFVINVTDPLAQSTITIASAGCARVNLCAMPQSTFNYPPGSSYQYTWSGTGWLDSTNPRIAPFLADSCLFHTYATRGFHSQNLIISDIYGCETTVQNQVNIDTLLFQLEISPSDPIICKGDSITLRANGTGQFLWSTNQAFGGNSITIAPKSSMRVSVMMQDTGCSIGPAYADITVAPGPQGYITGNINVCEGEGTILYASGGNNYQWSNSTTTGNSLVINSIQTPLDVWVIPFDSTCPGDTVFAQIAPWKIPVADFSTTNACEGEAVQFIDNSTVINSFIVSWKWDFGDPASGTQNTSSQRQPQHHYSSPGTYTVNLQVTSSEGCSHTFTRQVTVHPAPQADFTFMDVCEGLPHQFRNQTSISSGGTPDYLWRFDDGNSSSTSNPVHQYLRPGIYDVKLVATSPEGCSDSVLKTVFSHPNPIASFEVESACEDSVVLAFNGSSLAGGLDRINQWLWNFGDPGSSSNTSTRQNPRHVYGRTGPADINLIVTSLRGCTDDTTIRITIHENPPVDFIYENNCEKDPVRFFQTGNINPATPVTQWSWDFGNGQSASTPNAITDYKNLGAGKYEVVLHVANSEGCTNSIRQTVTINQSPDVRFAFEDICLGDTMHFRSKATIDSTEEVPGFIATYLWDFGGSGMGYNRGPEVPFIYDEPGIFTVRHTVISDSGCVSFLDRKVEVIALPALPAIAEDTVCFSNQARLLAHAPADVTVYWYRDPLDAEPFHKGYSWISPALPYSSTWYVESRSEEGCISGRIPINATVFEDAALAILPSTTFLDLPDGLVDFQAASTIPLSNWNWDFGDGTTANSPSPSHEYQNPGLYEVVLNTTDENGCQYTPSVLIEVRKHVTAFFPSAFSPNDDGFNDTYTIGNLNLEDLHFTIFSRWGMELFHATRPDFKWDGKDQQGQEVPEGVYVYVATYTDVQGKRARVSGTITLIR